MPKTTIERLTSKKPHSFYYLTQSCAEPVQQFTQYCQLRAIIILIGFLLWSQRHIKGMTFGYQVAPIACPLRYNCDGVQLETWIHSKDWRQTAVESSAHCVGDPSSHYIGRYLHRQSRSFYMLPHTILVINKLLKRTRT